MNNNQLEDTFSLNGSDLPKGMEGALAEDEELFVSRFTNGEVVVSRLKSITISRDNSATAEAFTKKWVVGQLFYDVSTDAAPDISIPQGGGIIDHPLAKNALVWLGVSDGE